VKCTSFSSYFLLWPSFVRLPPLPQRSGDHAPSTSAYRILLSQFNYSDEYPEGSSRTVMHFQLVQTQTLANPRTKPGTSSLPTLVELLFTSCRCGGTWNTIRENLDYIQNAGFTAIWISPVNQNYEGPRSAYGDPYHGMSPSLP
jgi:glycosidase